MSYFIRKEEFTSPLEYETKFPLGRRFDSPRYFQAELGCSSAGDAQKLCPAAKLRAARHMIGFYNDVRNYQYLTSHTFSCFESNENATRCRRDSRV